MYSLYLLTILSTLTSSTRAICSHNTHHYDARSLVEANFGYTGLNGPLNWYSINKTDNILCAKGRRQTPINLDSTIKIESAANYILDYPDTAHIDFENLGTTVEVSGESINGSFSFENGGKEFALKQFHFHTPSEHRIEDEYFPIEVHFVHVAPTDQETLVLGFVIEIGERNNPLLDSILPYVGRIPQNGDHTELGPVSFRSIRKLIAGSQAYRYSGSLTTPGCVEGISWVVSKTPLTVDFKTFNKVKKVLKFNSRYTQNNLGGENLLEHAAKELS